MEFLALLFTVLRTLQSIFPVEIALTLGVVFFALSWIRRRPMVAFPASGRRATLLTWLGIAGSLAVLAVATTTSWLAQADPLQLLWRGWWQRPAPLFAAAGLALITALALRREPLPAPGERAISPRRRWWEFAPRTPLWIAAGAAALLLLTGLWHSLIGVSAPAAADHYGIGPGPSDLPVYMAAQNGEGYIWGAGWPNHLVTLLTVLVAGAALAVALGGDANRPVFARATAASVREERAATARLLTCIALGGVLLTLGAVWAHIGFVGEFVVGVYDTGDDQGGVARFYVGTGYSDFAFLMHKGGYVVQGIGAALLLRLAVDTWRAAQAAAGAGDASGDDGSGSTPAGAAAARDPEAEAPRAGETAGSAASAPLAAGIRSTETER